MLEVTLSKEKEEMLKMQQNIIPIINDAKEAALRRSQAHQELMVRYENFKNHDTTALTSKSCFSHLMIVSQNEVFELNEELAVVKKEKKEPQREYALLHGRNKDLEEQLLALRSERELEKGRQVPVEEIPVNRILNGTSCNLH